MKFDYKLLIQANEAIDWNFDSLRKTNFICFKKTCEVGGNPVFMAWRDNENKISTVAAERSLFQTEIQKAHEKLDSMDSYLSNNSCSKAMDGPSKPTFACSDSDMKEVATTMCVIRELGAKACEKMSKDVIDIDAPKFFKDAILREGCGAAVHEIIGENYNILDKTIRKYTSDIATTMVSEILGYFSKSLKDAWDWSLAAVKMQACIPSGMELCKAKYVEWQTAKAEHFAEFDQKIQYCQQAVDMQNTARYIVEVNKEHLAASELLLNQFQKQKEILEQRVDQIHMPHILNVRRFQARSATEMNAS